MHQAVQLIKRHPTALQCNKAHTAFTFIGGVRLLAAIVSTSRSRMNAPRIRLEHEPSFSFRLLSFLDRRRGIDRQEDNT